MEEVLEDKSGKDNSMNYVIWFFIIFGFILLCFFLYSGWKGDEDYFSYQGKGGEYRFQIFQVGNISFYNIYTYVGDYEYVIPLRYKPQDVQNISFYSGDLVSKIIKPNIYITQDINLVNRTGSKSLLAVMEFNRILGTNQFGIYKLNVRSSLLEATDRSMELELPVITCDNVTNTNSVVLLQLGDESKIDVINDCIILQGTDGNDLIRVADRFSYYLLGVM